MNRSFDGILGFLFTLPTFLTVFRQLSFAVSPDAGKQSRQGYQLQGLEGVSWSRPFGLAFFSVKLSKFGLQQPQTRTLRHGAVVEVEVVSFLLFFSLVTLLDGKTDDIRFC